jgi:hypothetical protein
MFPPNRVTLHPKHKKLKKEHKKTQVMDLAGNEDGCRSRLVVQFSSVVHRSHLNNAFKKEDQMLTAVCPFKDAPLMTGLRLAEASVAENEVCQHRVSSRHLCHSPEGGSNKSAMPTFRSLTSPFMVSITGAEQERITTMDIRQARQNTISLKFATQQRLPHGFAKCEFPKRFSSGHASRKSVDDQYLHPQHGAASMLHSYVSMLILNVVCQFGCELTMPFCS